MGIMMGSGSTILLTLLGETALGNLMMFQSSNSSKVMATAVKVTSLELRLRGRAQDTASGKLTFMLSETPRGIGE